MKRTIILFLFFFLLIANIPSYGQFNYAGKEFYMSLGGGNPARPVFVTEGRVLLASKYTAQVALEFTNTGQIINYTVTPGNVLSITLSLPQINAMSNILQEQVDNKSLHITSDKDITVTFVNPSKVSEDASYILPIDNQSQIDKYLLLGLGTFRGGNYGYHSYSMVATCDSVKVEIIPTATTHSHAAGVPYTITLNKGETYQLVLFSDPNNNNGPENDLTGTPINILNSPSNFPLSILCTHDLIGTNPTGNYAAGGIACCADFPFEQLLPVNLWDTLCPVMPYDSVKGYRIKVLSSENNNSLYMGSTFIRNLNTGEFFDTTIMDPAVPVVIHATKPIAVANFMLSESWGGFGHGDPDMLWCMSPEQGIKNGYFKMADTNHILFSYPDAQVNVISKTSNVSSIRLNNNTVSQFFKPFPSDPDWMYAYIPIDSLDTVTTYHITSSEKVIAFINRQYSQGGWGYNISDVDVDTSLQILSKVETIYKCKGDTVTLHADSALHSEWSTGALEDSIMVTAAGTYTITELHLKPCGLQKIKHSFYVVDTVEQIQEGQLSETILKCPWEKNIELIANAANGYLWNTEDTIQRIIVQGPGSYSVQEIKERDNCKYTYTLHKFIVDTFHITADIRLGNDTALCIGDSLMLHTGFSKTVWSTGDTGQSITAINAGTYTASITDTCGNVHEDAIHLYYQDCPDLRCAIDFPDAFTPNDDGKNDLFRPIKRGTFYNYHLLIYDRWGRCVFETNDISEGWDGTYKGGISELDVYMYLCTVDCPQKRNVVFKGDVTLLR